MAAWSQSITNLQVTLEHDAVTELGMAGDAIPFKVADANLLEVATGTEHHGDVHHQRKVKPYGVSLHTM